ncbi:MAG TPA: ATP-binding protein [Archaeoglobaceae archaeon]|nr:ATP-binding protein [Archaeoglobaceae archaeon]
MLNREEVVTGAEIAKRMKRVKKKIGVLSGKGGVGKSTVSALLAVHYARQGYQVGIYDVDFLGPSIPRLFGIERKKYEMIVSKDGLEPVFSDRLGIRVISIQFLLPSSKTPVMWRGRAINAAIRTFLGGSDFGDLDYLIFDFPPGTGEAPLTVMDFVELDGIIMVTIPHDLSYLVVEKALKMAEKFETRVIGIVENMSYFICSNCGTKHNIFLGENSEVLAAKYGIERVIKIPVDLKLAKFADRGRIEDYDKDYFEGFDF